MPRIVEIKRETLQLTDRDVEGFLERIVTPIGTSAKVDVPKRFLGQRAYVILIKKQR